MKKLALHWKIIIGLVAGVIWAYCSALLGWNNFTSNWIAPLGKIFINLLKLIAIPLVLLSIIVGVSSLKDISKIGRIGAKTMLLYLATTVFSITIGLFLVNTIKPGSFLNTTQKIKNRISYELWTKDENVIIKDKKNFLENPKHQDLIKEVSQKYAQEKNENETNSFLQEKQKNATKAKENKPLDFLVEMVPSNIFLSLSNNKLMLQIVFFALFFGITSLFIDRKKGEKITHLLDGFNEVFLKMIDFIMTLAPFFVFALMAGSLTDMVGNDASSITKIILNLGWYSLTVVLGLACMVFIIYPLAIVFITRKTKYIEFFRKISPAQLLAFSSSSSAATLPITMECVNDNMKVPEEVSSFVLPIGATVNMDGTSLYQSVAVVYLAQMHLIELDLMQQLVIVLTTTLASIGSAAVPSAGLVLLMVVLESVGLNPAWIAIIFPIDRILDMCRTVVNVTGDITIATIVSKSEEKFKN